MIERFTTNPNTGEFIQAFFSHANTMKDVQGVLDTISARDHAAALLQLLDNQVDAATLTFEAPENHAYHVFPDRDDSSLTIGRWVAPRIAHGLVDRDLWEQQRIEVEGGYGGGNSFTGDRVEIANNGLVVVDEEGMGCQVPEPPNMYLSIKPRQTLS